ncbi:MAG TPA: hypothetical protein GXZ82_10140 [Firmicutes bacterium]|nr:hypothetical protein [Bacillota bacterium]
MLLQLPKAGVHLWWPSVLKALPIKGKLRAQSLLATGNKEPMQNSNLGEGYSP